MAETSFPKTDLHEYRCDANESVHLKLVKTVADIGDEAATFLPEMSHQIFGESETIFGYKGLVVELFYSASRLSTYVNIRYDEIIKPEDFDGLKADDVLRMISKHIPAGFHTNKYDFAAALDKEKYFKPFGEQMHSYTRTMAGVTRNFEIYKNMISAKDFRPFHERLQTFLLWFVDAASFIDVDDDRWTFYLIYEKAETLCGTTLYYIVGYQTVYAYYAYPALLRPRISQVLVLPPYQRMGHGGELLTTFYRECWGNEAILDITVEDSSEDYQRLRDFVDVRNCLKLDIYSPENMKLGFTRELIQETRDKLKINKKQCRRIYEIIGLKYSTPETLKQYRLDVKKRLHHPFQNNRKDFGKLQQVLNPDEYEACVVAKKDKHVMLDRLYAENVDCYRHILEKVASSTT